MKKIYFVLLCLLLAANVTLAQSSKKKKKSPAAYNKQNKETERFLQKQWWIGARGGVNLTSVNVEKTYSIIAPANYELAKKKYDNYKLLGSLATFEISFYFKHISLSFQPTFQHSRFAYATDYSWTSAQDPANTVTLNYNQEQKVDHLLLPILVRYEITGNKFRPYVTAGIFQAIRTGATKTLTVKGTDTATGGTSDLQEEITTVGATDLFAKNYWGLIGGVGAYYNLGNVRVNLDVQYKYGMSNITSIENRYANNSTASLGDSLDDLNMSNIAISIGCLFPMRFLENSFKSLDKKK
jgi:outer membrane protein W